MRRVNPAVTVSVRRNGFRIKTISRLKFEAGPEIAGWVNYRGKVHPVFKDPGGALFLDEDGWVSSRRYPLTLGDGDFKPRKPGGFRF
jgi:hypothetical protein